MNIEKRAIVTIGVLCH